MKFHYDKKEDIFYIKFSEKAYQESDEVKDGIIFDYDKQGKIIAIEVLDASKRFSPKFRFDFSKQKIPFSIAYVQ